MLSDCQRIEGHPARKMVQSSHVCYKKNNFINLPFRKLFERWPKNGLLADHTISPNFDIGQVATNDTALLNYRLDDPFKKPKYIIV